MKVKILVVDDEESYLDIIDRFLELKDCQTTLCNSSSEAMGLLQRDHFDVLITDIGMPIVNGFELIGQARKMNPKMKVVCLSGYADLVMENPLFQGEVSLLHKPFLIGDLLRLLELPEKKETKV